MLNKNNATTSSNLLEKIYEHRLVQMILCPLLECFQVNIIVIEESKDVDIIKIDELTSSFQTFEMNFRAPKKNKDVTSMTTMTTMTDNGDSDNNMSNEDLVLLARKFKKFFN